MAIGTTVKLGFDGSSVKAGLDGMRKDFSKISGPIKSIAKLGIGISAAFVAAGAAVAAIAAKINSIGEAANTSQDRLKNIVNQMGLFGDEAGSVSRRLLDLSLVTARQVGIDQKTIQMTQSKLATFKELAATADTAGGSFDRATMAAIDMASAGFGSAEQNAVQLGKALNDPIKGITSLARSGITFTNAEKEKIRVLVESNKMLQAQDQILAAIEKQIGGTGKATANASEIMRVSFSQVVESFAMEFSKAFSGVPALLEKVIPQMIASAKKFGEFTANAISDAMGGNYEKFVAIGELVGDAIKVGLRAVTETFGQEIINTYLKGVRKLSPHYWAYTKMTGTDPISDILAQNKTSVGGRAADLSEQYDLAGQLNRIREGNIGLVPGSGGRFRYAGPNETSNIYHRDRSTGQDVMVIEVLKRIESNTREGGKM